MPLTEQQKQALRDEAAKQGLDANALIAEAESLAGSGDAEKGEAKQPSGEPPKLFMYHLPFVRVREVRRIWLGLEESFPGDEAIAAEWAAKFTTGSSDDEPPPEAA